ncbi:MAG: DUF2258 domain-containing protein [Candidatus Methanomethylicota archaeon]|jgi:hypothetical protein|uniref:DUF2258 domain-containing protein n=1 Tax=Thermoproteota archaeon TaxID=2056631 RepID=A0A523BHM9_9CREN|nr:MAG: DUF2258 domain-containing protein [Candidatus Verstraetearchaeota archaeon]TDA40436.1 MAG: DUF2258 domain-containing protein [Candidatus Verstraetearchaeota archaeon]
MSQLTTGLVITGAYADKIRKTLFAQLKDNIKKGEIPSQEVARAIAELNRILYHILVEKLKLDKGDVVRIRIEYNIENNKIKWKYENLQIEIFKKQDVSGIISEIIPEIEKLLIPNYVIEKISTTIFGDHIYRIKLNDKDIGKIVLTMINGELGIIHGALLEPSPLIINKRKITIKEDIDKFLSENINDIIASAQSVESIEAEKVIKSIETLISR